MLIDNARLGSLRKPLKDALEGYQEYLGGAVRFEDFPDFALTPEKPNSARAVVPVTYSGRRAGDLYVILFQEGDGTGDAKTYKLNELAVPNELSYLEKPERVIPRAKTGVICEGFFPLFSMKNSRPIMFAACLDELGVDDVENPQRIEYAWKLGENRLNYFLATGCGKKIAPRVYFTLGQDRGGRRFGDPHAIYYRVQTGGMLQVAGFLAISDKDNPLLALTDKWVLPSEYK